MEFFVVAGCLFAIMAFDLFFMVPGVQKNPRLVSGETAVIYTAFS
jgi:hypothetical protein